MYRWASDKLRGVAQDNPPGIRSALQVLQLRPLGLGNGKSGHPVALTVKPKLPPGAHTETGTGRRAVVTGRLRPGICARGAVRAGNRHEARRDCRVAPGGC